jgi:hypothetical protein
MRRLVFFNFFLTWYSLPAFEMERRLLLQTQECCVRRVPMLELNITAKGGLLSGLLRLDD